MKYRRPHSYIVILKCYATIMRAMFAICVLIIPMGKEELHLFRKYNLKMTLKLYNENILPSFNIHTEHNYKIKAK